MTLHYTLMQIFYWSMFCGIYAFANNYLSNRGFYPEEIGMVIALSSLLSVFIQPLNAQLITKYKKITVRNSLLFSLFMLIIGNLFLYINTNKILIFIIYTFIIVFLLNSQTYIYAFIFEYINKGEKIDFGIARGLGSLSFAITSLLIGKIGSIVKFDFLPFLSIILSFLVFFMIRYFKVIEKKYNEKIIKNINFYDFMIKYKKFTLLLIGITFIFITHNLLNTFLKNIIETFIKDDIIISKQIGIGFMIAAIVELPIMYYITFFSKKIGFKKLLVISAIFFTLKSMITLFSMIFSNIYIFYLAQMTQIGGYAIYVPSIIYYTNHIMEDEDKIRGQAYMGSFATIGAIIGTLVGGIIIKNISVVFMIYFGILSSIIGSFLIIYNLEEIK